MPPRSKSRSPSQQLLVELSDPQSTDDRKQILRHLRTLTDDLGRDMVSWAMPEVLPRTTAALIHRLEQLGQGADPSLDPGRFLRLRLNPPYAADDLLAAWGDGPPPTLTKRDDAAPDGSPDGAIKELARMPGEVLWQPNLGETPGGMAVFEQDLWPSQAGQGVRVAFLAPGYQPTHPDYRQLEVKDLRPPKRHDRGLGTWTLGVLFAQPIHEGLVGICPRAEAVFVRPWTERPGGGEHHSSADAVALACTALRAGDVLLLAHTGKALPAEGDPATFTAIHLATALGIHVVQAAGDDPHDLDDPEHGDAFQRAQRDSGAVMVTGYLRRPLPPPMITTRIRGAFGTRVDAHAPAPIYTTKPSGTHRHLVQWFQGSTAAATQVAGVIAVASAAEQQRTGSPVTPARMRALLTATGTPAMMESDKAIAGTQPNLGALLEGLKA